MAGGISTVALAAAVCEAGGLGFLAAGYKAADAVDAEIAELRAATDRPFGLNIFVPGGEPADPAAVERYAATIAGEGELGEPRHDDDGYAAKVELAARLAVPVVSFTFGFPEPAEVERLQAAGCAVWGTVTTPEEARIALDGGADAVVLQGIEAGGHRGSFDDSPPSGIGDPAPHADAELPARDFGTLALLRLVAPLTDRPLIASGGIADGAGIAGAVAAGAAAAQVGTAFMLCPEAGTSPAHRAAIESDAPTAITRSFTGRRARGILNRFMREHEADAISAYPEVHHLTALLRAAAREAGDPDRLHLWAGQAHTLARAVPAARLVEELDAETDRLPPHISSLP